MVPRFRSAFGQRKTEQPAVAALNLRNPVLVKVRPEEYDSPKQIEYVFFADELTAGFGLNQYAIELVQPAFRYHVHMGNHLVALRITHQVNAQAFGVEENPGFYV